MNTFKPYIAALNYSFFVGLSFLVTKLVVPHASATLILAHRFTVSLICFTGYSLLTRNKMHFTKKKIIRLLPITLFYPVLFFALQVYGMQYTSSSEAGIIFATVPIITVILTTILSQYPSRAQILSIVLSVAGVITFFANNLKMNSGIPFGIMLLFFSAISFSIYTIIIKKILKETSVFELTYFIIIVGFLIFNTLFIFQGTSLKSMVYSYTSPLNNFDYLVGIFYLGFFASVVSSFASNYALQHISPPQFSVFSNLSTLISIVSGAIILSEPLYMRHFIGITLILTGVIGTNFASVIESKLTLELKNPELNQFRTFLLNLFF